MTNFITAVVALANSPAGVVGGVLVVGAIACAAIGDKYFRQTP